ncbi:hypothetical protein SAOR_15385 [Salinisphaera orenii MK-B5]|uniref:Uncharacterized protein n=1 Tax=Salinisphaera orenii MK-B5 TaxID=856730 RepID=A0A423PF17_9GAMM|nr:hypothetical protein [Salinisphaera orenii]ROO24192.1 hypothetical protein SAOR_15385 [Salinisphaera orenii MK-B5]
MAFSVQQIKFEFLSYMKEFEGNDGAWFVGVCADPEAALFASQMVDRQRDIWLWKPALTPRAALAVRDYFQQKFEIPDARCSAPSAAACCVFLYRAGNEREYR